MSETANASSAHANIPSKPSSSVIVIIYPPPEVRSMFLLCVSFIITSTFNYCFCFISSVDTINYIENSMNLTVKWFFY